VLDSVEDRDGQAGWHLEKSERVTSYVKNDHLDCEVLYDWQGATHKYSPDFIARLKMPDGPNITVIVEVKGREQEQDRAKYAAAEKWVRAINHHGGYGTWAFLVCKEPNRMGQIVDKFRLSNPG
jgi:type III restriction enzyme